MAMNVGELFATLSLNDTQFNAGLDRSQSRFSKFAGVVSKIAMVGAVAAVALVVKSLRTFDQFGTGVTTLTRLTDMSSQAASKLMGQWQRFGVDSQSGIMATRMLSRNLDTAQQAALNTRAEIDGLDKGSKTYSDSLSKLQVKLISNEGAFARLGVSIFDAHGKLKSVDTILPEVRDKLSQMDDAGQRTAMTLKLFGRGGAEMLGWLTKTPAEIAKVNKELADLSMVWGGKQIKDWKAIKDAQREMGLQWTALQLNLAQTLLPVMKTLMGYVQTGIKDWNSLSDGAKGFALKATAVVGILGLIGPKAIAAAAALKTMFAAQAVGGAASGAASAVGSAGGGLASGVASDVAAAAGIGGASKGYSALTASAMMGGKGVTPIAAIAGKAAGFAWGTAFGIAAVAAGGIGLAELVGHPKGTPGTQAMQAAGVQNMGRMAGSASADAMAANAAKGAAGRVAPLIQKLTVQMDGASYGQFRKLYGTIESIQKLAEKGIVLNTKDLGKQTTGDLRNLRSTIMDSLRLTAKQAETVLNTMAGHKLNFNWHKQTGAELNKTKSTVTSAGGKIVNTLSAAGKRASDGMAKGVGNVGPTRASAARLAAAARPNPPNTFGVGVSIGAGLAAGMASQVSLVQLQALNLANAATVAMHKGIKNPPFPSGVTRKLGQSLAQGLVAGMLDGRSNVSSAARGLALAGIPSMTGGASRSGSGGGLVVNSTVNVNAPVSGVDHLHEVIYSATMAAMEEAQVAEGRSLRGMVR